MFKRLFSLRNPLGIAISAAAIILTLSPEARKGTRKVLVKGAAALLSVGDQVRGLTVGARKELGTIVKEAQVEKEQMVLPDFSEMIKKAGESTKSKMTSVFDDMKFTSETRTPDLAHSMEMGEEFFENNMNGIQEEMVDKHSSNFKNVNKRKITKPINARTPNNAFNVMSDKTFNSVIGKPPIE
jgi:hypothetical protein